MPFSSKQQTVRRRGSVLLAMVLAVMALAALSLSIVQVTLASDGERRAAGQRLNAKLAAQAALAIVSEDLARLGDGKLIPMGAPWSLGEAYAFVEVSELEFQPEHFRLHAGAWDGRAQIGIESIVKREMAQAFEHGAFGMAGVSMTGDAVVDSYDSSASAYPDATLGSSGSIPVGGSQASIASLGSLELDGSAQVYGDLIYAPEISPLIFDQAQVHGSLVQAAGPGFLPESNMLEASGDANGGEGWLVPPAESNELHVGELPGGDVVVGAGAKLTLFGPGTYVMESLELEPGAELIVDASGGPVEILVAGTVALDEGAKLASVQELPTDVFLFCLGQTAEDGAGPLEMGDQSEVHAAVVAPNGPVFLQSNAQLFGSLSADRVDLAGQFRVHHDLALGGLPHYAQTQLEQLGWRVREVPGS